MNAEWRKTRRGARRECVLVVQSLLLVLALGCGACGRSSGSGGTDPTPQSASSSCIGDQCPAETCSACEPWEACGDQGCDCEPRCSEESACLDDRCGSTCPCPEGHQQTATGVYVPAEECHDSCDTAAWQCGELCGLECGACGTKEACVLGRCECAPACDGTRCDDGCGGFCPCAQGTVCNAAGTCLPPDQCTDSCAGEKLTCGEMCGVSCGSCASNESCLNGACAHAKSCSDCALSLRHLSKKVEGGKLREITLALEYAPREGEPRPRMADFHLRTSRPVWLKNATEGPALTVVNKSLANFEPWGEPWRRRLDGTFQLLAYEATSTDRLASGRIARLTFALDEWGPVRFSLKRREQVFAPPEADVVLQVSAYDGDVVVTR